ncbi:Uncharacterised protein [Serratia quinivorans]|nr:Uncharacterised protein [Serratia quinivorans]
MEQRGNKAGRYPAIYIRSVYFSFKSHFQCTNALCRPGHNPALIAYRLQVKIHVIDL